jgi:cyclic pyranopterin monophosphate synthase
MAGFSHLDESGRARMVNVTEKQSTVRVARAKGLVKMSAQTLVQIRNRSLAKGDPLEVARIAGILAAKNTSQLIPLCHPLALTHVDVQCEILEQGIEIEASVTAEGKTGVEMEALTAVSVAGLAIYDMCKAVDRNIVIVDIRLVEKSGGRSGHYLRKE